MIQGPEQIGIPGRLPYGGLEGRSLLIDLPVARELGLLRGQVVEALVSMRAGQMYLELGGRSLALQGVPPFPVGTRLQFRVVYGERGVSLVPLAGPGGKGAIDKAPGQLNPALANPADRPASQSETTARTQATPRFPPPGLARLFGQPPVSPVAMVSAGQVFQETWTNALAQGRLSVEPNALLQLSQPLTGAAVKQSLLHSGLFLESQLAQQQSVPVSDLKRMLIQLLRTLPTTSAFARAAQTLQDGVERTQADALQAQQQRELAFSWLMFLRDESPVQLTLRQGSDPEISGGSLWFIDAHLDPQDLGKVWMSSRVRAGQEIAFVMWAEAVDTADRARAAEADLRFELSQAGLRLEGFRVYGFPRSEATDAERDAGQLFELNA